MAPDILERGGIGYPTVPNRNHLGLVFSYPSIAAQVLKG